jgi:hypothetical protein
MGRAAQGVRILNIDRPDTLIGIDTVANEDEAQDSIVKDAGDIVISGELDLDGRDDPLPVDDVAIDEDVESEDIGETQSEDSTEDE